MVNFLNLVPKGNAAPIIVLGAACLGYLHGQWMKGLIRKKENEAMEKHMEKHMEKRTNKHFKKESPSYITYNDEDDYNNPLEDDQERDHFDERANNWTG